MGTSTESKSTYTVTSELPAVVEGSDARQFINRELSAVAFNARVQEEANDESLPLYERLKFLGIVASNLDEFFMVRVAGLQQQLASGIAEPAADGLLPEQQLNLISERVHELVAEQYRLYREQLVPRLEASGVRILSPQEWTPEQRHAMHDYFHHGVFPVLTPLAVDSGHPFPHLLNKSLNIAVLLRKVGKKKRREPRDESLAVVQVPAVLERVVRLPSAPGQGFAVTFLEEVIAAYASELFPGYSVTQSVSFRVTRNWDLLLDEEESEDLLSTIQDELRRRDRGAAVRLELGRSTASRDAIEKELVGALEIAPRDVYRVEGPLQLSDLMSMADMDPRPELRVEMLVPCVPQALKEADSIVSVVSKRDVLLHHPYESFEPVLRFIDEAAKDPNVLAIKQTLYRTSADSPVLRALTRAAENGKQVTVLVELKARFDEANNIAWARRLEDSGVHVVYGLIGLKTHCKVLLVVRREAGKVRRYVHLGTGNYNPNTARQYTDVSLFTARSEIADDVSALFNMLTGYSEPPQWKRLAVAPMGLQTRVLELIAKEADKARAGKPGRIVAKMNSLVDATVIRALYAASNAGVEIDLLVRGICCLCPGVPGVSERIRVHSVIDRFLEHSRIFAFGSGDEAEVFISSADWMPRNFQRRVEVMVLVEDPNARKRLLEEVLGLGFRDNQKSRRLLPDGRYVRTPVAEGATPLRSQMKHLDVAKTTAQEGPSRDPVLRPVASPEPQRS